MNLKFDRLISVFAESNDGGFVMQRLLCKQMNCTLGVCGLVTPEIIRAVS